MREGDERIGVSWYPQTSDQPKRRDADILAFASVSEVTLRNSICAGTAHDHTGLDDALRKITTWHPCAWV
jgi:hypothetical protein